MRVSIFGLIFTGALLPLAGCLGEPVDPRPLPRPTLDGALFDARRPTNAPGSGSGSGYGSGVPAPSGASGRMAEDAGVTSDGGFRDADAVSVGDMDAPDAHEDDD